MAPSAGNDEGRPEADVLRAIIDYCRMSESFANESTAPESVGLVRAYKDVADRLEPRLAALSVTPPEEPDLDPVFERQPKNVTRYRATRVIPPGRGDT